MRKEVSEERGRVKKKKNEKKVRRLDGAGAQVQ